MPPTFTTLPLEVRNEIYGHLFCYDSITPLSSKTGKLLHLNNRPRLAPDFLLHIPSDPQNFLALLSVNHQISDEAADFFYYKTTFHGKWHEIVAFVKGIGARRGNMIRSMEISHPNWYAFIFDKDEDLEMLSGLLPNLRTLHIAASAPDFTRLQNELIQGGILKIAGKLDIGVCNTWSDEMLSGSEPRVRQIYRHRHVWRCDKGTTQWTGGDCARTIISQFDWERQCWINTGES